MLLDSTAELYHLQKRVLRELVLFIAINVNIVEGAPAAAGRCFLCALLFYPVNRPAGHVTVSSLTMLCIW